ncbi:MAG: PQQ-dependent sugar dehydrogenase [Planctomycetes bacterium]|nr:PQQ-dependent sugar dehydrogenase [Planctomycetota bacterium]
MAIRDLRGGFRRNAALLVPLALACTAWDFEIGTVRVASGLSRPVFVASPPGDADRLFIIEQHTGRIKILNLTSGVINPTPFLQISGLSRGNEQGLLGLAFHPNYAKNGFFYVNVNVSGGATFIRRYTVSAGDPDIADPASVQTVISYSQPFSNHNGGWIGFGPDGFLYIAAGDGGSGGDPGNRAQDITNMKLGKLLRLDVDVPGAGYNIPLDNPFVGITGDDEIWAYGLRNPYRCSFDRVTGDLYIGDVGQNRWEEIDFQPAASMGGENYGWRCYEGDAPFNTVGCPPANTMVFPIHTYSLSGSPCAVSGGYVYRGSELSCTQGTYFFADYCSARIFSFRYDGTNLTEFTDRTIQFRPIKGGTINSISSFGEDDAGELYICDLGGEIFKIIRISEIGDMNCDGAVNGADIDPFFLALGNPVAYAAQFPNCCPLLGDMNRDGALNGADIDPFFDCLGNGNCP